METEGVFTIVTNEKEDVLLVKRKDYPIWDLPGGRVDAGELLQYAALREVREETGYDVEITNKVGTYKRPQFNDTQHILIGRVTGGQAIKDGDETAKVQFFNPKYLPILMVPHRKRQIRDYRQNKRHFEAILKDSWLFVKVFR